MKKTKKVSLTEWTLMEAKKKLKIAEPTLVPSKVWTTIRKYKDYMQKSTL